ncbi:MAG: hypothetical protein CBARDCOR_6718 [uncultured Caballeronia sp.]|nr:MAG: hypothetical protein CBARDCOR_6718 [uncultured Caballeronia sp.]
MRLLGGDNVWAQCEPGRYLTLNFMGGARRPRKRNYSIIDGPGPGLIEIAVKREGDEGVSSALHDLLTPSSLVRIRGWHSRRNHGIERAGIS